MKRLDSTAARLRVCGHTEVSCEGGGGAGPGSKSEGVEQLAAGVALGHTERLGYSSSIHYPRVTLETPEAS